MEFECNPPARRISASGNLARIGAFCRNTAVIIWKPVVLGFVLFVCMLLAGPLAGHAAPKKQNKLQLDFQAGVVGSAEVGNGPAELSYSEYRLSGRYRGFDFGYELRNYEWSRTDGLPFAPDWDDPFNEMHTLWVGYEKTGRINQKWGWRAYGRLSSSFENDIMGAPNGTLGATVDYAPSKDVIIMAGVFGSYNEADRFVMPVAGLLYRPDARDGFSGSLGFPFSRLSYHFTEKFALTFRTGFIRRTYKLADDNPVRANGEFRTSEYSTGLAATYEFSERWSVSLGADYLFNREITFFEDGGENETDYDLENTMGGWARIQFSF